MPDDKSDSDAKDNQPSSVTASKRLRQVASHLPADYSDVLAQIDTLRSIAATPDASRRGYIRQKQAGKLWVRERLDALLDPGSFQEIGSLSGTVTWEQTGPLREKPVAFVPSNNVQGMGRLRGRRVLLTADDFTLRSGHADGASHEKTIYIEKLALALKLPIVKLVDGSSGGGSVTLIRSAGYSYLPYVSMYKYVVEQLNQGIPNLGAVVGPAIGLGAARVVSCHFSVMAADVGSLFNAGPEVVKGATFEEGLDFQTLGGPVVHCTNGTIDNVAANEAECYEQLRTVLGYLPNSGREVPPVIESEDPADREDEALRRIIPRRQTRMYNPWTIIRSVVDRGSWFEIGPLWGRTAIGGLARLDGRPVGVVSLNCEVNGGALDAAGSQKLTRLLKLCDVMNLPVLQFIDVPGYAIGTVAERTATMRWGVELGKTYFTTTTPLFSVIVRRAYGVAGGLMLGARDPVMQVAWPSGQWGSLPLEGGIEVAHRQDLREAEQRGEKAALYQKLEEEYRRLMNPVRTANAFGVEEIIDPKDTRRVCCAWARQVYGTLMAERLADRATGKIRPVFA
ncbi:alpha subunit of methylmalonyl-CoA decarboxylase [Aspergillus uvarum CBS 121591]|uniref:Propionyl-CoA carboxylase beta chain, mitochondrial n=1 Tax=Aspergillus uvarum CBS 121591 TaxID=1448315 RepID=A0A319C9W3_9EURO|nr:alpha subunit of methylmalonyl-CoA decarboxylase [Aspergillus uvarum CBS 121591]PYH80477.1 alpha subunit of methylmalonyl-CoA decarboxylase [Aspergillus uvarum CBS 121591]